MCVLFKMWLNILDSNRGLLTWKQQSPFSILVSISVFLELFEFKETVWVLGDVLKHTQKLYLKYLSNHVYLFQTAYRQKLRWASYRPWPYPDELQFLVVQHSDRTWCGLIPSACLHVFGAVWRRPDQVDGTAIMRGFLYIEDYSAAEAARAGEYSWKLFQKDLCFYYRLLL